MGSRTVCCATTQAADERLLLVTRGIDVTLSLQLKRMAFVDAVRRQEGPVSDFHRTSAGSEH